MQKWVLTCIFLLPAIMNTATAQTSSYTERVHQYVVTHRDMAIEEQRRTGVPAAIKLGQGILETSAGESRLCVGANNHFGIKCKKTWEGETFAHTDDAPDECFRKYACVKDSYTDHSDFLSKSKRYASLFQLKQTDYKGWAHGLKRCGYATNPRYAQQLIKIIEEYKLQEYTQLAMRPATEPVAYASLEVVPEYDRLPPDTPQLADASASVVKSVPTPPKGVQTVNGLKAFYARKGDVLLDAAIRHKIHYPKLLEMNDLPDAPLEADMFIYLERKNTKGKHQRYIVQPGESLIAIAQAEGMQLRQLRAYNMLGPGEEPQPGTVLYLQQPAPDKPPVVVAGSMDKAGAAEAVQQPVAASEYIILKKENKKKPAVTASAAQHTTTAVQTGAVRSTQIPATAAVQQPVAIAAVATTVTPARHQDDTETPLPGTSPHQAVNIAAEPAIEELMSGTETQESPAVTVEDEPQDELSRLKAKMDKVVYGSADPQVRPTQSRIKVEEDLQPVTTEASSTPPAVTPEAAPDKYHIVKKGETAFGISKKYNITMKQLREWNNLEFEAIRIDQKLRVKP